MCTDGMVVLEIDHRDTTGQDPETGKTRQAHEDSPNP